MSEQKYTWTIKSEHDNYEDALNHKNQLLEEGEHPVKIHRMGKGGHVFAVKVGSGLKKEKPVVKEEKKSRPPARTDKKAWRAKKYKE